MDSLERGKVLKRTLNPITRIKCINGIYTIIIFPCSFLMTMRKCKLGSSCQMSHHPSFTRLISPPRKIIYQKFCWTRYISGGCMHLPDNKCTFASVNTILCPIMKAYGFCPYSYNGFFTKTDMYFIVNEIELNITQILHLCPFVHIYSKRVVYDPILSFMKESVPFIMPKPYHVPPSREDYRRGGSIESCISSIGVLPSAPLSSEEAPLSTEKILRKKTTVIIPPLSKKKVNPKDKLRKRRRPGAIP